MFSKGRLVYIAVVAAACLIWKLFFGANWQGAISLVVFLICVPVLLDAMVRRRD